MIPAVVSNNTKVIVVTNQERINELQDQFIANQDVKENSKALYRRSLRQYFVWVKNRGIDLSTVTRADILNYKDHLLLTGHSSLTVGSYITAVRRFYEWAEGSAIYPNVAKGIKSPKRKQQFKKQALSADQSIELIAFSRKQSLRDFAILSLLIRTGVRTVEVIRANMEDITYKNGKRVLMIHGKGRDEKDNFVIITDKCFEPIEKYLNSRPRAKNGEPLFISTSNNSCGERLTTRSISKIAKESLKSIGLNGRDFTAHSLRHTTAVNILRAGGRIEDAQGVLRHSSPATTQIYTATIKEEIRLKNAAEELLDGIF